MRSDLVEQGVHADGFMQCMWELWMHRERWNIGKAVQSGGEMTSFQ